MNRSFEIRSLEKSVRVFARFALAGGVALAAASCGSSTSATACDLNACDNTVRFQRVVDITGEQAEELSISFCRSGSCWVLTPTAQPDGSYNCSSVPAGATCLLTQYEDTGWSLTVSTSGSLASPMNGEMWTITATVPETKTTILDVSATVDYQAVYPNGDSCGPGCETADIP